MVKKSQNKFKHKPQKTRFRPWADELRPTKTQELIGQEELLSKNKFLLRAIKQDKIPSMVLWGPPGSGKTTLAQIIAQQTSSRFISFSAATGGVKEIKKIIAKAQNDQVKEKNTILFIDEIHRFNKSQQDVLLPYVEDGTIILIGATTENPSFEVNAALLSRTKVFVFNRLDLTALVKILKRIKRLKKVDIDDSHLKLIAHLANGDARAAINALQLANNFKEKINKELIKEIFQKQHLLYDKDGEEHYNLISALHKSLRGGDADAALYWLMRMLEGGEEPLYIARRLIRFASEDIGLANNTALLMAVSCYQACHFLGLPECDVILGQCVAYLAKSKKSVRVYQAVKRSRADIKKYGNLPVPLHIRNAPTRLMKDLNYGKDYKYSPDYNYKEKQSYLPKPLKKTKYL
ncbi:MAG: AAA family ATPase [Candidatus Moranbacteria bacterium]|nr:AAA family ATPase [Candidatus Moranbacteria bacterium]